ncbi:MAG: hypothetical protein R6U70_01605 [Bacillota bacterium]
MLRGRGKSAAELKICLSLVAFLLLFLAGRGGLAAPYGWPESWSEVTRLGVASRYVPAVRAAGDRRDDSLHLMWVADEPGGADAAQLNHLRIGPDGEADQVAPAYCTGGHGRISEFDFDITPEGVVHWAAVQRTESLTSLVAGAFSHRQPDAGRVMTVTETDLSIVNPAVRVVDGEPHVTWCDSTGGVLTTAVEAGGYQLRFPTSHPSAHPRVFCAAGELYVGWVDRVSDARRLLVIQAIGKKEPDLTVEYSAATRDPAPALSAGDRVLHLLLVTRAGGTDRLLYLDIPAGEWAAVVAAEERGRSILAASQILDPQILPAPEGAFTAVCSEAGPRGGLNVRMSEIPAGPHLNMTPTLPGSLSPQLFRDSRGHMHLVFLTIRGDTSYDLHYMNTLDPARITLWNVVGIDEHDVLISFLSRFATAAAMAAVTLLPNILFVMAGSALLLVLGGRIRGRAAPVPAAVLSLLVLGVHRVAGRSIIHFTGQAVGTSDVLAAAVIASACLTLYLVWKRAEWKGDVLAVVVICALWLFWFILLTLVRAQGVGT